MSQNILVIGAGGQVGTELVISLRNMFGNDNVVATDLRKPESGVLLEGPFETLDVLDKESLLRIVNKYNIDCVYQLAAILSATGEKNPPLAWDLNMNGLFNVLDLAKEGIIKKVFWPSSIAIFGKTTPSVMTPQSTICEPTTVYGISKLAGERWCEYYFQKYNVDVRSIRYPGLIGYKSMPGGGTTDYAVDIFHQAILKGSYDCFLEKDAKLPMMYMEDAIRASIEITEAESDKVKIRSSYNISAMSFSPKDLAEKIKIHIPEFQINYNPDFRQKIADTWPDSIEDKEARKDWNWNEKFGVDELVNVMLQELSLKYENEKNLSDS